MLYVITLNLKKAPIIIRQIHVLSSGDVITVMAVLLLSPEEF